MQRKTEKARTHLTDNGSLHVRSWATMQGWRVIVHNAWDGREAVYTIKRDTRGSAEVDALKRFCR